MNRHALFTDIRKPWWLKMKSHAVREDKTIPRFFMDCVDEHIERKKQQKQWGKDFVIDGEALKKAAQVMGISVGNRNAIDVANEVLRAVSRCTME